MEYGCGFSFVAFKQTKKQTTPVYQSLAALWEIRLQHKLSCLMLTEEAKEKVMGWIISVL